jgi:hypothetical protein
MSAFRVGRRELAMTTATASAFASTTRKVEYEYDFGSTTALTGELLGTRQGSLGRAPVRVLARNEPISWSCGECEASATLVCPFCIDDGDAVFCDAHAATHEHAERKSTFRWSIHREWAFAATPGERRYRFPFRVLHRLTSPSVRE